MLKIVLKAFMYIVVLFALIHPASFAQDGSPPAKRMGLKKLAVKGTNTLNDFCEWLKIDDSSSMAFIEDYSLSTDTRAIYSLPISSKGKVGTPTKYLKIADGWFDNPSAVWIPEYDRGLVFIAYAQNVGSLKIDLIPFDKNGKKLAAPTTLLTINAPAENWVHFSELKAVRGGNRIGVFAAASFWTSSASANHYTGCTVRFFETSLTGKLTTEAINIPLPANGKLKTAVMYDAAYNDGNFLAPIIIVQYETYNYTPVLELGRPVESTLYVFSAPGNTSKASDIGMNKITVFPKDNFGLLYIIPQAEDRSLLLYNAVKYIPDEQVKLDKYESTYFIQKVDSSGKKIKRAKKVKAPGWQHKISYYPDRTLQGYSDEITTGIMADDGTFFVAQTFCVRRRRAGPSGPQYDYEQLFRVLNIDSKSGKTKVISEKADTKDLFFSNPLILSFGKNLAILNQGYPFYLQKNPVIGYYSKYRSRVPLN